MLDPEEFQKKYNTTYSQIREESFLEQVSEEDKEIYDSSEILTGKNRSSQINKFNNFGKKNLGKKYSTVRGRAIASFKKFIDQKISQEELDDIWDRIWLSSKRGNFNFSKLLLERMLGKEEEQVNIKVGNIKVELNIPDKFKKKEE